MTMEERTLENFIKYNEKFFEGKLDEIKLEWSKRMQISAAIFYPDKKDSRKSGKICLNQKLLKTRTDKEVLETLLHEMTHAYLQQLHGNSIRPHGKEFQAKILEINIALNLDITLHHSFLSWWRCDGVCRNKDIHFYGFLSGVSEKQVFGSNPRAVKIHQKLCGGTFSKVEEPNAEIQSELRRIKRKRKSLARAQALVIEKGEEKSDKICCTKEANIDGNLAKHTALKRTRYSTESGEE